MTFLEMKAFFLRNSVVSHVHRCKASVLIIILVGFMMFSSFAELQQVEVGGEIRIRYRWYINAWEDNKPLQERLSADTLLWRPIGSGPLGAGMKSLFKWDSRGKDWTRFETSLLLNFKADFTNDISTFIELYDFHVWGEEFRSNYLTGADVRANSVDSVMLNQGYIEMRKLFDKPLTLRIGRQNLLFGNGWLLSNMTTPSQFISFDALRLTYQEGDVVVDAFASKLNNSSQIFDDQTNLYGIYGTYSGFEPVSISAYWLYIHDNTEIERKEKTGLGRWINSLRGLDYGSTNLHTVGTRLFGKYEGFDYNLELAYQFGDAAHLGSLFKVTGSNFGDTNATYDNWGVDATLGYTFEDVTWKPRLYVQGVWFDGQDNRDISFWDWLNPFYRPQASVSFNRLFSDKNYMPTINDNSWISNIIQASAGVEVQPTEKLRFHVHVAKNWVDEPFNPPKSIHVFGNRVYVAPLLSFWTDKGSDDLGWEVAAWARYTYSQDLWFLLYGNYLWTDDGLTDGSFIHYYGTQFSGGTSDSNAGYLFWMAVLKF